MRTRRPTAHVLAAQVTPVRRTPVERSWLLPVRVNSWPSSDPLVTPSEAPSCTSTRTASGWRLTTSGTTPLCFGSPAGGRRPVDGLHRPLTRTRSRARRHLTRHPRREPERAGQRRSPSLSGLYRQRCGARVDSRRRTKRGLASVLGVVAIAIKPPVIHSACSTRRCMPRRRGGSSIVDITTAIHGHVQTGGPDLHGERLRRDTGYDMPAARHGRRRGLVAKLG